MSNVSHSHRSGDDAAKYATHKALAFLFHERAAQPDALAREGRLLPVHHRAQLAEQLGACSVALGERLVLGVGE